MSVITVERRGEPAAAREMMPSGLALSATLHIGLLALIVFGLPNLFRPPPPEETPIAVELVTIGPETRATHPNPYRPEPRAKPEPPRAAPAPIPQPKPQPPTASEPPPAAAAPPPAPPPPHPRAEAKAPPPPPPPPKPVEARAPTPPPPIPEPKPKPEPQLARHAAPSAERADSAAFNRLIRNLDEEHRDKPEPAAFDALLKNLARQQTAEAAEAPPARPQPVAGAPPSSQPKAPLGSQLTASEKDLIIEQIERCWNVPVGARDAQDLNIEIKAVVNPDGSVRQATIVDTGRYAADPFFRAAADSAKRAVLNPQCSPLRVPPDKYEAWHDLDLFFNPKDLL
jgi:hypothetical protein